MLTREEIAHVERTENRHHEQINATFARRDQSKKGYEDWKAATSAWHAQRYPTDFLWSDEFLVALGNSKRQAIEDTILYLEVDPWYFRSGYLKERLLRKLKSADLTERDKVRLRNVIWNVAAGKNRREFRRYCSLAPMVANDGFRWRLADVSPELDRKTKGKFSYLREYLEHHTPACVPDSRPDKRQLGR